MIPVLKNEVQRREVIRKKERNMNHKDTRGLVGISFYVSMPMLEKIQSFQGKSQSEKIRTLIRSQPLFLLASCDGDKIGAGGVMDVLKKRREKRKKPLLSENIQMLKSERDKRLTLLITSLQDFMAADARYAAESGVKPNRRGLRNLRKGFESLLSVEKNKVED